MDSAEVNSIIPLALIVFVQSNEIQPDTGYVWANSLQLATVRVANIIWNLSQSPEV